MKFEETSAIVYIRNFRPGQAHMMPKVYSMFLKPHIINIISCLRSKEKSTVPVFYDEITTLIFEVYSLCNLLWIFWSEYLHSYFFWNKQIKLIAKIQKWNGAGWGIFLVISWMWSLVHFIVSSSVKCLRVALRLCPWLFFFSHLIL